MGNAGPGAALSLTVSPPSRAGVGLRSERGPILLALMVSTGLVAIDATILATAVPSIVRDIGGYPQFPWLFSVYLLAQAVSVPVYAKLADTFGRKPFMLFGIGLFLLGSVLCGVAWSMPALIAFRALQGLGAGAVQPMTITIAGDIYTVAERATAQGYIASVWAVSSVVGPTLGGLFAQFGLWRWIFFVNVPLCLLAGVLIARNLRETVERREHRIDYLGAVLLTSGMTLLILGVLEGGQAWAWSSPTSVAVFAGGAALFVAFVLVERRAAEPVLPLWVLRRRLLATTTLLALGVGAILIGLTAYVPTYLKNALGVSPLVAGLALAALTRAGRWRRACRAGCSTCGSASARRSSSDSASWSRARPALALLAHTPSVALVAVTCFVIGLGMGLVATPSLIAAQASVGWAERGVVTGANMFARSIGSAVGAAVFGAVANGVIAASGGPRPTRWPPPTREPRCSSRCSPPPSSPWWPGSACRRSTRPPPRTRPELFRALVGLRPGLPRGCHAEPGDPAAVHRDDRERVAERGHCVADDRDPTEAVHHEAAEGLVGPRRERDTRWPASSSRCSRPSSTLASGGSAAGSNSSSISPTSSSMMSSIVTMPVGAAVLVDDHGEVGAARPHLGGAGVYPQPPHPIPVDGRAAARPGSPGA